MSREQHTFTVYAYSRRNDWEEAQRHEKMFEELYERVRKLCQDEYSEISADVV